MLDRLRLTAALSCLLASQAVVVLWIHSSRWQDTLYYVPPHGSRIYRIDTYSDTMFIGRGAWLPGFAQPGFSLSADPVLDDRVEGTFLGFKLEKGPGYYGAYIPFWLAAALPAVVAALLASEQLRRFNLRTLLIATTLAALTLGAGQAAKNMTTEFYWCPWSLERPIKSD
jgi:hypothetical protein